MTYYYYAGNFFTQKASSDVEFPNPTVFPTSKGQKWDLEHIF